MPNLYIANIERGKHCILIPDSEIRRLQRVLGTQPILGYDLYVPIKFGKGNSRAVLSADESFPIL